MIDRHSEIILKNNRKVYRINIMEAPEETEDDIYIRIFKGERLDLLAKKYYGNDKLWYIIALANNWNKPSVILDDEEMEIRIPKISI